MTKLDYRKSPERDPARVLEVRDSGVWSGNDAHPFETQAQRAARYAATRKAKADERKRRKAKAERKRIRKAQAKERRKTADGAST